MTERRFNRWKMPTIRHGRMTKWNWMVHHPDNLELGANTDIGAFTYINALHGVVIEHDVQIGSHCSVYSVSTIDDKSGKVVLKESCRIGTHSTVMPGITIGRNSIIGAHSFVNHDIPDNVIAFGCPIVVIGKLEIPPSRPRLLAETNPPKTRRRPPAIVRTPQSKPAAYSRLSRKP